MVRTASLFSQLLHQFPRDEFARLVRKHRAEYAAKGFDCWTQFVAMLFCHLARADSLREICNGLACCLGKLSHLGVRRAPNKSVLSYANRHRPADLYEDLFWAMMHRFRSERRLGRGKHRFRFRNPLLSMDATVVSLCLSLFPWAEHRRAKGGIKLHVLLDHADYMPSFVHVTEASVHESQLARQVPLRPGSIVAMDRGYNDYAQFARWTEAGVYFVTRMKRNAKYKMVRRRVVPRQGNVLRDEEIRLTGVTAAQACPHPLRRIVVWDADNGQQIVLLTNHLTFGATTIAAIYKERWQIELFFKALKQHLRIKTFVGTSANALLIQIWTALLALLLLKWLHHLSRAKWSLSNLAGLLRLNLFTYRDLRDWLNEPLQTPPQEPPPQRWFPGFGQPAPS